MRVVCILLQAFTLILFARVILEWVPVGEEHPVGKLRHGLRLVTQPVLAPVRALLPPVRMGAVAVDLSPLVVIVLFNVLAAVIC